MPAQLSLGFCSHQAALHLPYIPYPPESALRTSTPGYAWGESRIAEPTIAGWDCCYYKPTSTPSLPGFRDLGNEKADAEPVLENTIGLWLVVPLLIYIAWITRPHVHKASIGVPL